MAGLDLSGNETAVVNTGGLIGAFREARYMFGSPPREFVSHLRSLSPVLLHAHFGSNAVNALQLRRLLDVPLVVTFHGYDATQRTTLRNGLRAWRYGRRRPMLIDSANCLLAVSNHIRKRLIALGIPAQRIRTHHIGVDLESFSPAALGVREPVVLGVGRFVEKKGFEFLIEAMAEVQRHSPEAKLVLIGDGPLVRDLQARASQTLNSFRIFGPCSPDVVVSWMKRARVLAVPSVTDSSGNTEGLPLTVIEAMATGLPVVATHHAGIPEAVTDGVSGFLVPERDASGLAGRILEVIQSDSTWTALSTAGLSRVKRDFDLTKQTRKLELIYSQLK